MQRREEEETGAGESDADGGIGKRRPSQPPLPPPLIKKLYLYSTPTHVLVFGRSKDRQRWRVLRIERDDGSGGCGGGSGGSGEGGREAATAAAAAPLPPSPPPPPPPPPPSSEGATAAFFEPNFLQAAAGGGSNGNSSTADPDGRRPLRASADSKTYDRASAAALLSQLSLEASANGGELRLLTRADAIVGCLRFSARWHYLVVVTRKRLEACFGGGISNTNDDEGRTLLHKIYSVETTALQ